MPDCEKMDFVLLYVEGVYDSIVAHAQAKAVRIPLADDVETTRASNRFHLFSLQHARRAGGNLKKAASKLA
jgi:hypothetical protein